MYVLHVAFECAPIAKVGGLGDVLGALPKFLRRAGIEAAVLMPRFGDAQVKAEALQLVHEGTLTYRDRKLPYRLWLQEAEILGFPVYLLEEPMHFGRPGVYQDPRTGLDFPDQGDRFFVFQRGVLEVLKAGVLTPDLLHLHDHHTALLAVWLREDPLYQDWAEMPIVFTVHNAEHQGRYDWSVWEAIGVPVAHPEDLQHQGQLNALKAGLIWADAVTTVSPGYARELQERNDIAAGLQEVFQRVAPKMQGILNGIDPELWNPATDPLIFANYSVDDLSGKEKNKVALCKALGLRPDRPLLVFIGRLVQEKGIDLLVAGLEQLLTHQLDVSVVVLGTGRPAYQAALEDLRCRMVRPGGFPRLALRFEFNNTLAHQLYAAGDMLLMPSRVEPCGLNQMYAMTYGTVPIVHAVGGLRDTVEPWEPHAQQGTGFRFETFTPRAFHQAIRRALTVYYRPEQWRVLQRNGMRQDWSWSRSAQKYLELYRSLVPVTS
ncbi:glycogen synthase [Rhodothermus profundi]|uniref:Glycogen synthase n=1 Tax=Rhodothermus profundi TaxID=633813 RepID=A0A1M6PF97_9BACT|nr:glycogen/starch synthase [Rhodothermus profundi]SHK06635.1 glycogen synthase (ADP-glucose) [Rhodothermus profundi]